MFCFVYQVVVIIDILVQDESQYIVAMCVRRVVVYLNYICSRASNIIVGSRGIHTATVGHHHFIDTVLKAAFGNKLLGIGSIRRESEGRSFAGGWQCDIV